MFMKNRNAGMFTLFERKNIPTHFTVQKVFKDASNLVFIVVCCFPQRFLQVLQSKVQVNESQ